MYDRVFLRKKGEKNLQRQSPEGTLQKPPQKGFAKFIGKHFAGVDFLQETPAKVFSSKALLNFLEQFFSRAPVNDYF